MTHSFNLSTFLHNTNLYKLRTKEDPIHLHKMLAIIVLFNFIYRYYLLLCFGSMFLNTPFDLVLIAMHGCLSLSSLIFHIPQNRHIKLPMIYPEFRLHSIAFGMRSVVCCFINYYEGGDGAGDYLLYYKMGVCFTTMLLADGISNQYIETRKHTTMRSMPFAETTSVNDQTEITRFHSNNQVNATLFMLLNTDAAFSPLFAIQIAAFLMTLVRKNIITPNTWHLWYSWSLMINIFVFPTLTFAQVLNVYISTHCFRFLRMTLRMNKYLSWTICFFIFAYLNLYLIFANTFIYAPHIIRLMMTAYLAKNIYNTRALYISKKLI